MKLTVVIYFLFLTFSPFLVAQSCYNTTHTGDGTYYDSIAGTSSGNCSIPIAVDDYQYCAMNELDYNNSESCDACINLTGPNGSIILRVVDRCPECLSGDVDMSELAFSEIADVIDGRVDISWVYVECPLENNIEIVFKEGTSQYWGAIQLRNLKHAISSLEYLQSDGTWKNMDRQLYNFFLEENGITSPVTLRATSVLNEELIFENISYGNTQLESNFVVTTSQQFSTPDDCNVLSIGTNTIEETKLSYYPNPVKNELYIESNSSNFWKNKIISISTISGKSIINNNIIEGVQTQKIELNAMAKGIYILNILEKNKILSSHKVVLN